MRRRLLQRRVADLDGFRKGLLTENRRVQLARARILPLTQLAFWTNCRAIVSPRCHSTRQCRAPTLSMTSVTVAQVAIGCDRRTCAPPVEMFRILQPYSEVPKNSRPVVVRSSVRRVVRAVLL